MHKQLTLLAVTALVISAGSFAHAQTSTQSTPLSPKSQYAGDSKQAMVRYKEDLKLCRDEKSSAGRLQCKRDARTEYNSAVAAAKTRVAAARQPAPRHALCAGCGTVVAVNQIEKQGEGSAVGLIAGGVAGAVLGHQVGGGLGKDLATVAGAAGGAYAGKEIEKRAKSHNAWIVSVKSPDGARTKYEFAQNPGFRVGDTVRQSGNTIARP